jgi:uncharacterized protein (DUF934 family)
MPERVIRAGRVEDDGWVFLGVSSPDELAQPLPAGAVAVPLPYWKEHREALLARRDPTGVWLGPFDEPAEILRDFDALGLVAVLFPKFTDGRGYSTAALLRTRYGYRGELRAFGDVGRDQLFYLKRCGFDSFQLAPHRDPEDALPSLRDFSLRYQGSVDDPLPLFRKRALAPSP